MLRTTIAAGALALAFAAPAWASECVGGRCAIDATPSAREVQTAVDAYLASAKADASLVGGAGSAGYDGGFWIRGGSFLMKINLTLQTRWEWFDWDDTAWEPSPGGDLSGFSLPRATLKFSGDATCDVHYYAELEFGHSGLWIDNESGFESITTYLAEAGSGRFTQVAPIDQNSVTASEYYGLLREGWIEYEAAPQAAFRMGLIKTAATRQMMTAPEMQQFVDVSMASAFSGQVMPGYTDRNRDYGFMVHGALGCDGEWQYMVTVTNGDGVVHRNVLDGFTSDNFAYSARLNWDVKGHLGYEEGALQSTECAWALAIGAWVHYYADAELHRPFVKFADRLTYGIDAAFTWGGLSVTAAYSAMSWDSDTNQDIDGFAYLGQVGYLFPGTAWEIAARYSYYQGGPDGDEIGASEFGAAVNYYIDGHADKVTLDVAFISPEENGHELADTYAGYNASGDSDAMLVRLQWQLAL
ncbi:MAG: hypothetical protein IT460_14090 [Planctomycetes bacterium]|nr:hypothetical protein [Planctomycetota bacterium]